MESTGSILVGMRDAANIFREKGYANCEPRHIWAEADNSWAYGAAAVAFAPGTRKILRNCGNPRGLCKGRLTCWRTTEHHGVKQA